jgi:hypothetical protein
MRLYSSRFAGEPLDEKEGVDMAESESDGEFRVTERRRRAEADEPPPATPRTEGQPHTVDEPQPRQVRPEPTAQKEVHAADDTERSLEGLFVMLASSAVVALGEAADPMTGQVRKDPDAAADAIDLLGLLREKTEGNRTPRETQLLEELIYDLQLRYVSAMKPRL